MEPIGQIPEATSQKTACPCGGKSESTCKSLEHTGNIQQSLARLGEGTKIIAAGAMSTTGRLLNKAAVALRACGHVLERSASNLNLPK